LREDAGDSDSSSTVGRRFSLTRVRSMLGGRNRLAPGKGERGIGGSLTIGNDEEGSLVGGKVRTMIRVKTGKAVVCNSPLHSNNSS
jgi:hypothetical protein